MTKLIQKSYGKIKRHKILKVLSGESQYLLDIKM